MSYNGWSNLETWKVNLEMVQDIVEFDMDTLQDLVSEHSSRDKACRALADYFENTAFDIIDRESTGWSHSLATSFLSSVDWLEIAHHYIDDIKDFSEEETEESDE
jgi:hypothetical protein